MSHRFASEIRRALSLAFLLGLLVVGAKDARAETERPWLGVMMGVSPSIEGVLVKHVVRGSPADRSGLRDGDRIVRIETAAVRSPVDVAKIVGTRGIGDSVTVVVAREGRTITSKVTLATMPPGEELLRMDRVGTFAPPLGSLEGVEGNVPASMSSLRGRVVVVDFWATWCLPCRATSPVLSGWTSRYGAQGLSIVGVSSESSQTISAFLRDHPAKYPVASDPEHGAAAAYGVSGLPTLFVIDKKGVIRSVVVGFDSSRFARLEADIQALLAEPAPTD
ncbi:MAG: redoxin domain-containing protein [Polyangiaceae bacterium]